VKNTHAHSARFGHTASDRDFLTHTYDSTKGAVDSVCSMLQIAQRALISATDFDGKTARVALIMCWAAASRSAAAMEVAKEVLGPDFKPINCSLASFRRRMSRLMPFTEVLDSVAKELLCVLLGRFGSDGLIGLSAAVEMPRGVATPVAQEDALGKRILAAYPKQMAVVVAQRAKMATRQWGRQDFLGDSTLVVDDALLRFTPGAASPAEAYLAKAGS